MGEERFGWRKRGGWRSRRKRVTSLHLGGKISHICRARSVRRRSGCWYSLMRRRVGQANLWGWFRLLNHGLLQLLLCILQSSSFSSLSPLAASAQSPSTTLLLQIFSMLLLLVLELGRGSPACLTMLSLFACCWLNQDAPARP